MAEIIDGIVQVEHPALRANSREVQKDEFGSPALSKSIDEMKRALESQFDGVAIAAPQIGENIRLFVVSKRLWEESSEEAHDKVFINPIITKRSKKTQWMEEGCLSIRWKYGEVRRSTTVTVRAQDEAGDVFTYTGSGIIAQIFQHEIDHLDGVLFTDTAKHVRDIDPETVKAEGKDVHNG